MFGSLSIILSEKLIHSYLHTHVCTYVCVRVTHCFICELKLTNTNAKPGALTFLYSLLIIYSCRGYISFYECLQYAVYSKVLVFN